MSELFLQVVNMSISAGWIVLAVILLRLLFKRAPRWITVLLWGIVAVRLVCPYALESEVSIIPSVETISPGIMMDASPAIDSGVPLIDNSLNPVIRDAFTPEPIASANPLQVLIPFFSVVWMAGIVLLLLYAAVSYGKVKRKISTAVLLRDRIYQSENIASPFVFGIIQPKIVLPYAISEQDMELVIAHEQAHIRRKDHLWKPLGFLILICHWFNPIMWIGYVLFCRDMELACDEKVIKAFDAGKKADYAQALLNCSTNRRKVAVCPLAFGEVGVKGRVKAVLHYKKPAVWLIIVVVFACVIVAACVLTNPSRLKNIEHISLSNLPEETVSVLVSDGEHYEALGAVSEDLLHDLLDVRISRKEISSNRSNDRDASHTIVLQTKEDTESVTSSYLEGLYIYFSSDFTSVWVDTGVKPTLSYKVLNPKKAREIYENIENFVYR